MTGFSTAAYMVVAVVITAAVSVVSLLAIGQVHFSAGLPSDGLEVSAAVGQVVCLVALAGCGAVARGVSPA